jgi:hypothetical protein
VGETKPRIKTATLTRDPDATKHAPALWASACQHTQEAIIPLEHNVPSLAALALSERAMQVSLFEVLQ